MKRQQIIFSILLLANGKENISYGEWAMSSFNFAVQFGLKFSRNKIL